MLISYTWIRLHKISENTTTCATDSGIFCNQWKQKIVLHNPDMISLRCELFDLRLSPYIPDKSDRVYVSTAPSSYCAEKRSAPWQRASPSQYVGEHRVYKPDEIRMQIFYDNDNKHKGNHGNRVFSMNDSKKNMNF